MTPSPPNDGLPLAISEQDGSTLWPREHYPSADDALRALDVHLFASDHDDLGPDLEPYDIDRVRLVWAGPHSETTGPGWWEWVYSPRPGLIECWEVTPR